MRIYDIEIYRDGGSIEFRVERDSKTKHIWLDTPFSGEPRALRIDSVTVVRGDDAIRQLLADIEVWWATLAPSLQEKIREVMTHKGPLYNPDAETSHASDLTTVLKVRDYVSKHYAA